MNKSLRLLIRQRASERCEYCHLPQAGHEERFSIDHVIAKQHVKDDSIMNLALSCLRCNLHKGTNLAGIDPADGSVVRLFHPRQQIWTEHFSWNGPLVVGATPVGRTTMNALQMNSPDRVRLRQILLAEGILRLD